MQNLRHPIAYLMVFLAIPMTFSCSTTGGSVSKKSTRKLTEKPKQDRPNYWNNPNTKLAGKEAEDYNQLLSLYQKQAFDSALKRARIYHKRYPKSLQRPRVYNLSGLIQLRKKRAVTAIRSFMSGIQLARDSKFKSYLQYNLATAQYEAKQFNEALKTVENIDSDDFDLSTQLKYHYVWSRLLAKRGLNPKAGEVLLSASYLLKNTSAPQSIVSAHQGNYQKLFKVLIKRILKEEGAISALEELNSEFSDSPLADHLLYVLGRNAINKREHGSSERYLQELITRFPQSEHYEEAIALLRNVQNQTIVNSRAIGVLLPMTGRFASFGRKALQATQHAFNIFNSKAPHGRITLFIEDSGETPESAVEALNRLYFEHKVVAVVGPLLSRGIDQVTQRAQELGVPLISLAQQSGNLGDYVFQISVTPKQQAWEIARYAIEYGGMKNFAILYPEDKFGRQYSQHFWDAVEAMGGKIVGFESYPSKETDFRLVVEKLAGLHYTDARQRELDALKALRAQEGIKKRTRRTEKYFRLPPIKTFDAVFIPDEAKAVGQILPTFAYEDMEKIQFLGINTWNSSLILKRAEKYAENALFVDFFFSRSQRPRVLQFNQSYRKLFERTPTGIEALAYDASLLLDQALLTAGDDPSRSDIRDRLRELKDFPGVTGQISQNNGLFDRPLKLLTIKEKQISEITRPELLSVEEG